MVNTQRVNQIVFNVGQTILHDWTFTKEVGDKHVTSPEVLMIGISLIKYKVVSPKLICSSVNEHILTS